MSRENDIKREIEAHHRRLQILKERRAFKGKMDVDPAVIIEIAEIEAEIEKLQTELAEIRDKAELPPEVELTRVGGDQERPHRVKHRSANRDYELKLFKRMLADPTEDHLLLIEAPGGWGKSTLLREFMRLCRPLEMVPVDFKSRAVGLHNIFFDIYDILGWDRCARFAEAAGHLANITLAPGTPLEQTMIETALRTGESENLNTSWDKLTRALFEDLDSLPERAILIFDAFEAALDNVQDWFSQVFLRYASRSAKLVVVIAGREVPDISVAWRCQRHTLSPINDPADWQRYYREHKGVELPIEGVRFICLQFDGHPIKIAQTLDAVARKGGWL